MDNLKRLKIEHLANGGIFMIAIDHCFVGPAPPCRLLGDKDYRAWPVNIKQMISNQCVMTEKTTFWVSLGEVSVIMYDCSRGFDWDNIDHPATWNPRMNEREMLQVLIKQQHRCASELASRYGVIEQAIKHGIVCLTEIPNQRFYCIL